MGEIISNSSIILSFNRALLGEITDNLRAIICDWNDSHINVRSYFEAEANDLYIDSMECIAAEVVADFPAHSIDVEYSTIDLSQPVNNQSILSQHSPIYDRSTWIFTRRELDRFELIESSM